MTNLALADAGSSADVAGAPLVDLHAPALSNEFLSAALAGAGVGTWQLDFETGQVTWDAITSGLLGLERVSVTTEALLPVHEDDQLHVWERLQHSRETGDPYEEVFRAVHSDGRCLWLHANGTPLPAEAPSPRYVAGIISDVTSRRLAEEASEESERRLSTIIAHLPGVAYRCETSTPWSMSFISDAVATLTGYAAEDFLSGVITWGSLIFAADREAVIGQVSRAIERRSSFEMRYRIRCASGEVRWVHERGAAAYSDEGEPLFLEGFIGDIHEQATVEDKLRQSEELFRLTSEATQDVIWDLDLRTGRVSWNAALCQSFGYPASCLGSDIDWWEQRVHPDDRHRVNTELASSITSESGRFESEYRFLRADCTYADILDRGSVIRNEAGKPVRMVGAMQDNTARNAAIRALREREADLSVLCEHATIGILHRAADGTLLMVNRRFCEILGRSEAEFRQLHPDEFTHPDDVELNAVVQHDLIASGGSLQLEKRYLRPDGTTVWCEVNVSGVQPSEGRPGSFIVVAQDITEKKASADALRRSEERLRLIQDASELADFESDVDAVSICSDRFFEQAGLPIGDGTIEFREFSKLMHPDDALRLESEIMAALDAGDLFSSEFRLRRADTGEERWISCRTKMIRNDAGEHVRTIGAHLDITERKRSEEALRESEERFRLAAEAAGLGIWDYDASTGRRDWSDRLREILGLPADEEATLETAVNCVCLEDRARFVEQLGDLVQGRSADRFQGHFRIQRVNDSAYRWIAVNAWRTLRHVGDLGRMIVTARDITDEKTAEERVIWSASHDALTGLANRGLFQAKLDDSLQHSGVADGGVGLLMLDVDHFKQINDSLGHQAGDELLKMFAKRLQSTVRSGDTVARLGGDEFAIVVQNVGDRATLSRRAEAILERLRDPFIYGGRVLDCRASIGASRFPTHGATAEELLRNADLALYAAKSAGRSTWAIYEPRMRADAQRRTSMIQMARDAISGDRLIPYYQPKVDLSSGSIVGFEALLRWRDFKGGIHLPSTVAAAFEDIEVAAAISDRMIDCTIRDMQVWLQRGVRFEHIAVNASAAEFRRDDFAERVLERLRAADIATEHFQLEVTETVFLGRGAEYVHRALDLLSSNGVKIALDDFGTGYASLRHLKQFPVDIIKIDRSFLRNMEVDLGDEAIVRAVINLGRSLGIKVVAEGVENEVQVERLMDLDCDYGQGFLFSKAVPASRVPAMIERFPLAGSYQLRLQGGVSPDQFASQRGRSTACSSAKPCRPPAQPCSACKPQLMI